MVTLRLITRKEFESCQPVHRIIVHDYARMFAFLTLAEGTKFALSWRSDLVTPVVVMDETSDVCWVGVDERVAAVNCEGSILFSVALCCPLLSIHLFPRFITFLCDAELVIVNRDFSISAFHHLNDIPEMVAVVDGKLIVNYIDGSQSCFDNA